MSELVVVDAEGQILGRMASRVAKMLLQGNTVWIINCERAVMSGKASSIMKEYQDFMDIKSRVQPKYTPRHPRKPENFIRMVVRGMIPRRKARGLEAYKRLRVFVGNPGKYNSEPIRFEEADVKRLRGRTLTVGDLMSQFGWVRHGSEEATS